ncbi:LysR substrate-binding domain-containing protein [Pseudomonadota bacterium]
MKIAHLNGLRALEAAVRTGSFRAAADELGVTTAAVGQQIRTLEAHLGRQLFLRTSTGVQPNEDTRLVSDKLTSSFSVIENVIAQLKGRGQGNRVAVTLPRSFAENWLVGHLSGFYRMNSEIDLRLDASNRMVDLLIEDFDFAIRYGPPSTDTYDEKILFGDYVLPVCSPEFANRFELSECKTSLIGVPLVHLGDRTPDPDWADWDMWSSAFGFETDSIQTGPQFTKLGSGLQAAISGHGLVLCGVTEAYNAIERGLVVIPFGPTRNCPTGYKYRLLSVRGRSHSELQKQFKDWIIEIAEGFRLTLHTLISKGFSYEYFQPGTE